MILSDREPDSIEQVVVGGIFASCGATPPDTRRFAHEMFYVLSSKRIAHRAGGSVGVRRGSAMPVRPGSEHVVENTGTAKLCTLTIVAPDERVAELVRAGPPVTIEDEDRLVCGGLA